MEPIQWYGKAAREARFGRGNARRKRIALLSALELLAEPHEHSCLLKVAHDAARPTSPRPVVEESGGNARTTHFSVHIAPNCRVGLPGTVRVVAEDAQNNIVSNYAGTLEVTSSDAGAALPSTITFRKGEPAFFQLVFATPGQQQVTVRDGSDPSIVGMATMDVAEAAAVTHFSVYLRRGVALGATTTVRVAAEDARNQIVANYAGTAELSSSDRGANLPPRIKFQHGFAAFRLTFVTPGEQSLTVRDCQDSSIRGAARHFASASAGRDQQHQDRVEELVGAGKR